MFRTKTTRLQESVEVLDGLVIRDRKVFQRHLDYIYRWQSQNQELLDRLRQMEQSYKQLLLRLGLTEEYVPPQPEGIRLNAKE